jgi:hypothetical protein
MTAQPVEWVLVVRYVLSTHRATYGRLAGTTYTKDYLQLSRRPAFIKDLEAAFPALSTTTHLPLHYEWPKGSASGTLVKESADRPHLAWGTANRAPPPWKMADAPSVSTVETIRGDPSHETATAADREFHQLIASGFGQPFLVAVKLRGDEDTLHLSVLIKGPEHQFEWADIRSSPHEIQELAARTSPQSALAWRYFADEDGFEAVYFDPSRKVEPWGISGAESIGAEERTEPAEAQGEADRSDFDSDLFAEGLAHSEDEVSEFELQLASGNYEVPDSFGTKKTRGSAQRAFAAEVKKNYGWRCALTGIQTRSFLIASHIVPWSVDEKIRLDPSNGICLSVLVDRAFENGILVVEDDLTVTVNSEEVQGDIELMKQLGAYDGMKLHPPKAHPPNVEFLRRRRSL